MPKITAIAYVESESEPGRTHTVIKRGSMWECDCAAFYYSGDRRKPCKHILMVRSGRRGNYRLSKKGRDIVRRWRDRHAVRVVKLPKEGK